MFDENYRGYDLRQKASPAPKRVLGRTISSSSSPMMMSPGGSSNQLKRARQSLRNIDNTAPSTLADRGKSKRLALAPAPTCSARNDVTTRSQKKGRALPVVPTSAKVGGAAGDGLFAASECVVLADFGYKQLLQTPASWLVGNVPIWSSQRPCCAQRVQEIVAAQQARETPRFQGVISVFKFAAARSCLSVPQHVAIFGAFALFPYHSPIACSSLRTGAGVTCRGYTALQPRADTSIIIPVLECACGVRAPCTRCAVLTYVRMYPPTPPPSNNQQPHFQTGNTGPKRCRPC